MVTWPVISISSANGSEWTYGHWRGRGESDRPIDCRRQDGGKAFAIWNRALSRLREVSRLVPDCEAGRGVAQGRGDSTMTPEQRKIVEDRASLLERDAREERHRGMHAPAIGY